MTRPYHDRDLELLLRAWGVESRPPSIIGRTSDEADDHARYQPLKYSDLPDSEREVGVVTRRFGWAVTEQALVQYLERDPKETFYIPARLRHKFRGKDQYAFQDLTAEQRNDTECKALYTTGIADHVELYIYRTYGIPVITFAPVSKDFKIALSIWSNLTETGLRMTCNGDPDEMIEELNGIFGSPNSESTEAMWWCDKKGFAAVNLDNLGRETAAAQAVARRVGLKLIQEKKAEVLKAASDGAGSGDALRSRDLLTLLIKANMSEDVPEDWRLSDEDVLVNAGENYPVHPSSLRRFFIAGHETTNFGTAFSLFALAQAQDI
ncbi:hypothetical protein FOMPIDRAFT_1051941 [Fomitopsis schrenkii]|uniref:Uncharacterized protein n=1 Tax=Fomitopsis schrenkii TaxID=2126942 RepID=S8E3N5_FOMSC|nr:hypothetical protein FOMPIDRAFT_1051941 [Fomitopsis schrenkii]